MEISYDPMFIQKSFVSFVSSNPTIFSPIDALLPKLFLDLKLILNYR
jgi:hypothetical protein